MCRFRLEKQFGSQVTLRSADFKDHLTGLKRSHLQQSRKEKCRVKAWISMKWVKYILCISFTNRAVYGFVETFGALLANLNLRNDQWNVVCVCLALITDCIVY